MVFRSWTIIFLLSILFGQCSQADAQTASYEAAYATLKAMLENKQPPDFTRAVFTVENAWYDNELSRTEFDTQIKYLATQCQQMIAKKRLQPYRTARNWAIFMLLTQKVSENNSTPYTYDFEDFTGNKDYTNTFVTRLLKDHKGNCLSLPLLYKCVAQQLGAQAQLTIGPSHSWIRHLDEKSKWANVELTSGQFPSDGLMMTELGISTEAIRSGAYGKELSEPQALAFMLTQLALSYEHKTGKWDAFTDKCADLSIRYFAPNVLAYMIKANRITVQLKKWVAAKPVNQERIITCKRQLAVYQAKLHILGAGTLDSQDYSDWVKSMKTRSTK